MILSRHFSSLIVPVLALAFGVGMLAGCATTPDRAPRGSSQISAAEANSGPQVTIQRASVMDDGEGAVLCVGAIPLAPGAMCGGPHLVGWTWEGWQDHYSDGYGIRSGTFDVTGFYDSEAYALTPTEVRHSDLAQVPLPDDYPDFTSPCPAPDGGWKVRDADRADDYAWMAAIARAEKLPGFAGVWLDQSLVGMIEENVRRMEQGLDPLGTHPELVIVNIRMVGDLAAAEAELRELWGGPLCVTLADHTEAELQRIKDEIMADLEDDPGRLSFGTDPVANRVEIEVTYDDGTLQGRYDEKYGLGVVRVQSVLQPVD